MKIPERFATTFTRPANAPTPGLPVVSTPVTPVTRVRQPLAWHFGNRLLNRTVIDYAFRCLGAEHVAAGTLDRFASVGLPYVAGMAVLTRVRGWDAWHREWEAHAAQCLEQRAPLDSTHDGNSDGDGSSDGESSVNAWRDRTREAAIALHVAQLFVTDVAGKRALHERAAALYREVAPLLDPPAEAVALRFRGVSVPGFLSMPRGASMQHPAPLAVFLNGGSTSKEELTGWREPFLARGFAVLALDNPGTGESWGGTSYTPNQHALLDDLRHLVAERAALDGRIALIGVSLGGMLAVDLATEAPDLAAVITITSPFAPGEYITEMAPLTQWEVAHVTGFPPDCLPYLCHAASLAPRAPRLFMPTLIVGAGKDWIVPPREAKRLYAACVAPRTLHWYPQASHCCFSHLPMMLTDTARWLARAVPVGGK